MTKFSDDLPHHVIFSKILPKMRATKFAVQSSFILSQQCSNEVDAVSSLASVLDFDEDDDVARHNDPHQHDKFVKFLQGYLEYYVNKEYYRLLDTLRLNMRVITSEDISILGRWLDLVFEKRVKALDISCPQSACSELCWLTTFANAKHLTSLKLDCVRFKSFGHTWDGIDHDPILPSLKSLSLNGLGLGNNDLSILLTTCPSLEYLSLTDFCFEGPFRFLTRSLKSLEFIFCEKPANSAFGMSQQQIDIVESFTWIGVLSNQLPRTFYWTTLFPMARNSLTFLNIECVKIVEIQKTNYEYTRHDGGPLFPSLKTLSFTNIRQSDGEDLLSILTGCPSLECLSLTDCCGSKYRVSSSSLKSLEIKHCSQLRLLQIDDAENLESFKFLSQSEPSCKKDAKKKKKRNRKKVVLDNSFNLKNVNICVADLVEFSLNGYPPVKSHLDLMDSLYRIAPSSRIKINLIDSSAYL